MTAPPEKRKWYQFSLLSLLVLMTLAAGGMGIFAHQLQRNRLRHAAISRVFETVDAYDGYIEAGSGFSFAKKGIKREELKSFLDDLQWWWEGPHDLYLDGSDADDQNMKQLGKLRSLEGLNLKDTQVTDEGLRELAGLTDLIWINVENCAVTDAGLVPLSKLSKLEYLEIEGTQITPAGEKWIKEILPNLKINP